MAETEGADGSNDKVVFSNLEPGDNGSITWTLANTGSLNGTLTVASTVTCSDVSANEPESAVSSPHGNNPDGNGDLDEFLGVTLKRGIGTNKSNAESNFAFVSLVSGAGGKYVELNKLESALNAESNSLAATGGNDTIVYKLSWQLLSDIVDAGEDQVYITNDDGPADDNIIQSDKAVLNIDWTLTQS